MSTWYLVGRAHARLVAALCMGCIMRHCNGLEIGDTTLVVRSVTH